MSAGPGALRRRITIQQPADAPDGAGGVTRGYATLAEAFADVEPLSAQEMSAGRTLAVKRLWRVTLRARGDLSGGHRVLWAGKILDIVLVRPLDADRRFEELLCEETGP